MVAELGCVPDVKMTLGYMFLEVINWYWCGSR